MCEKTHTRANISNINKFLPPHPPQKSACIYISEEFETLSVG